MLTNTLVLLLSYPRRLQWQFDFTGRVEPFFERLLLKKIKQH
jgi:hypothetical protein